MTMRRVAFRSCLGTALVMAGLGFLLPRLNLAEDGLAGRVLDAWPVLLIVFGLEEVWLSRGRPFPMALGALLTVAAVLLCWSCPRAPAAALEPEVRTVQVEPVDGAYELAIEAGAADIELEHGGGSGLRLRSYGVAPEVNATPGRVEVSVDAHSRPILVAGCNPEHTGQVKIGLPDYPVRIEVDAGAGRLEGLLREVPLKALSIKVGAGRVRLVLPKVEKEVPVRLKAGAAKVIVEFPEDTGVRVRHDLAVGRAAFDGLDVSPAPDGAYETEGYRGATGRFDVEVEGGVSSLTFTRSYGVK